MLETSGRGRCCACQMTARGGRLLRRCSKLVLHALQILGEIIENMSLDESVAQQKDKSQGVGQPPAAGMSAPRAHALQRARKGFQVIQMVAEFRALRATVLRLWAGSTHEVTASDINDVTRFNEAVDQALTESLLNFVTEVD